MTAGEAVLAVGGHMLGFLERADRSHGVFSHFNDGDTGRPRPMTPHDDGADCRGLTASDGPDGYAAHDPAHDTGTITPSAALASLPCASEASLRALRHFRVTLGEGIWSRYGSTDAFDESRGWYATSYLAIDLGPIVCMIENHRSGLLWRLFMSAPEVRHGLHRLGFTSPALSRP